MTSFENADAQIRSEQRNYHKQQGNKEFHKGMNKKRVFTPNNKKPQQRPHKPKTFSAKGHDKIISAMQIENLPVKVWANIWDDPVVGNIVGRDRFTITVQEDSKENKMLIFKSAIVAIEYPPKKEKDTE